MLSLALFTLFGLAAVVGLLVVADSAIKAAHEWRRLAGELRMIALAASLPPARRPAHARGKSGPRSGVRISQAGWRAAA